jgi:amino acid permease
MKTTKTLTYALTLDEVKKSLAGYNGDMLIELVHSMFPGTTVFGRKDMANLALLATDSAKLEAAMEKHSICWISVPNNLADWADVIASFPCIFLGADEMEKMIREKAEGTEVIVTVAGRRVDAATMMDNY